eukprot:764258-Hanusia_phi.AAC.4
MKDEDIEFAEGLTSDTFALFPRDKLDSSWVMAPSQEQHANSILALSKNLQQIRFRLCPRKLKDEEFWQFYFAVVQKDSAASELGGSWGFVGEESETVAGCDAVLVPRNDSYWEELEGGEEEGRSEGQ